MTTFGELGDGNPDARGLEVGQRDIRAILNALPAMVGYWDRDLRNRMANAAYEEYFGVTPEQLPGMHIRELLGEEVYAKNLPYIRRVLEGEEQLFDRELTAPDGEVRHTQASYVPDTVDGQTRGFFVLVTDVTARHRAEQAQAAAERRFRALFDMAPVGTFLVSLDGVVVDANPAAARLLRSTREKLIGRRTADFTDPRDVELSLAHRRALVRGEVEAYRVEKRYRADDGTVVWAQLDACLLPGDGAHGSMLLAQVQDITERREHQAQLERVAVHDALTGLMNRRGLTGELERAAARARRHGGTPALLVLDLDHFKAVNDTLGHPAGDAALVGIARVLRARLREGDVIARHGGDEFAVLLPQATRAEADRVARDLRDAIAGAGLGVPGRPVTAAVGVAILDEPSAAGLLAAADDAMYRDKPGRRAGPDPPRP